MRQDNERTRRSPRRTKQIVGQRQTGQGQDFAFSSPSNALFSIPPRIRSLQISFERLSTMCMQSPLKRACFPTPPPSPHPHSHPPPRVVLPRSSNQSPLYPQRSHTARQSQSKNFQPFLTKVPKRVL